jgi:predicted MFS family arabinose efflux permease
VFDIAGTIASGALSDRVNPRILLACYYGFRGVGLAMLPSLLSDSLHPSMIAFVVVYGLDWVATVPPTAVLCRQAFGESGTIVFGWVFAAHQIGAAIASVGAGVIRDETGAYTVAWFTAAALCAVAAVVSFNVRRPLQPAEQRGELGHTPRAVPGDLVGAQNVAAVATDIGSAAGLAAPGVDDAQVDIAER